MHPTQFSAEKEKLVSQINSWLSSHNNPYDFNHKERAYRTILNCRTIAQEVSTINSLRAVEQIFNSHKFVY